LQQIEVQRNEGSLLSRLNPPEWDEPPRRREGVCHVTTGPQRAMEAAILILHYITCHLAHNQVPFTHRERSQSYSGVLLKDTSSRAGD